MMKHENTDNVVECDRFDEMAKIWLEASVAAHDFIPCSYWEANTEAMRTQYLPASKNYGYVDNGHLLGFISLRNTHIEALFVGTSAQGRGIGRALLGHAKASHPELTVAVYCDNRRAVGFYVLNGFEVLEEGIDSATGCSEFVMGWKRG